jgi:AAA+ ATPase superfamily predicted ATPase
MSNFFGREQEIAELQALADQPGSQFLILYGRRRVGKTTLALQWAEQSGLPTIYWVANRLSPTLQRRSLSQTIYNALNPGFQADANFTYPTWEMALQQLAQQAARQRLVFILDEFPYAAEAEPGLASILQNVWDHHLKSTQIYLILAGSHIGMMTRLLHYQAPLYGRFTGHLHLKPLPFSTLKTFLPRYTAEQRVAVYAILGGIPAYLERFDDSATLRDNIDRLIFRPTGIFRADPLFLLQDQVREPRNYLSVLHAIGQGAYTLVEIANSTGLAKQNISTYLGRLEDLYLVERRAPVTLPPQRRLRTRQGRWRLRDPYLRFYFRFVQPNQRALELGLMDSVWASIREQLRAFIGMTAFEELSQAWVVAQAQQGQLPFAPEDVGSHWAADVQVDVVALNWRQKAVLLGECKWGASAVGRSVVADLIEHKTPKTLVSLPEQGRSWEVHHILFARAGFTDPARELAKTHNIRLLTLAEMDEALI